MSSWEDLEQEALDNSDCYVVKCKFGQYLDSLGDNAHYVYAALRNESISANALYRALRARGMQCGVTVLKSHKNRECSCYKENT